MAYRIFALLSVLSWCALAEVLSTTDGPVEGRLLHSGRVVAYLGIPYALPPTGNLRFENAQRSPKREATLQAAQWPRKCFAPKVESANCGEDCLYLSLLLSAVEKPKRHLLAIFSNSDLDNDALFSLVDEDFAVALIHFRQGVLGHFAREGRVGDDGLSDVRTALSWLDDNREHFGVVDITILAENDAASAVAHAVGDRVDNFKRAILLNGNQAVRRFAPKYASDTPSRDLLTALQCNKTNGAEAVECLKSADVEMIVDASSMLAWPEVRGAPFRPNKSSATSDVYNVILGVQSSLSDDYQSVDDFSVSFTYEDFMKFLGSLISPSEYRNVALLRKLAYNHYLHMQRSANKDPYFLWGITRNMLLERDFFVPTRKLAFSLDLKRNFVWLWEYPVRNPVATCLQQQTAEEIAPFCSKMWEYFRRFAVKGRPTETGCDPKNPSWPALRSAKRDYHIFLTEGGQPDWRFDLRQTAFAFWNDLVPEMEQLEVSDGDSGVLKEFRALVPEDSAGNGERTAQKAAAAAIGRSTEL